MAWFPRYVRVSDKRARAEREIARLAKKERELLPVKIEGRKIATTFWGQSWCTNLERYMDFATRLPRGRSYVKNGSVVDLQIGPGRITALVSGTMLYEVSIEVTALPAARWETLCGLCVGEIGTLVDLLQGKLSPAVMERICAAETGLFPAPAEIALACSCPDWATMCKHVAAVLYGVGARLDERPELLFGLRQVQQEDLLRRAAKPTAVTRSRRVLDADTGALAELFGVELGATPARPRRQPRSRRGSSPR
jgi:uncharacterized Zn finger protein